MKKSRRTVLTSIAATTTAGCLRLQEGDTSVNPNNSGAMTATGGTGQASSDADNGTASEAIQGKKTGLYAFDADSGEIVWVHETAPNGHETQINFVVSDDETVYYATDTAGGGGDDMKPVVRAIDRDSAEAKWESKFESDFFSGMSVYGNQLLVCQTYSTYILDASTGDILRQPTYKTGWRGFGKEEDTVYFISDTGVAVDRQSKTELWRRTLNRGPSSAPVIRDDTMYYGTNSGHIVALDTRDGTISWESRVDGSLDKTFTVGQNAVWIIDETPNIYAFDRHDGTELYRREAGIRNNEPIIIDDLLYIPTKDSAGVVYEVRNSGNNSLALTEEWRAEDDLDLSIQKRFVGGWTRLKIFDRSGSSVWESKRIRDDHIMILSRGNIVFDDEYVFVGARVQ